MADERSGVSSTQVMVALIGAAAVIGSALIANSERLFGPAATSVTPAPSVQPAPSPSPAASVPAAAVISSAPPQAAVPQSMVGAWRGVDGQVWTFQQEGDRAVSEKAEGVERVRMEAEVSGQAVRIWVDYFQQSSGEMGIRIMNCDGRFAGGGQQVELQCINPQTNVTTRPVWVRV